MIVVLNNKSNLNKQDFLEYQAQISTIDFTGSLVLCPSTINIGDFKLTNCDLGCQNVSKYEIGAHTGEIAASQLKSYDVKYCIVGHSERRISQHENTKDINEKIKKLLQAKIIPILCVGETKEEKENNRSIDVIKKDLQDSTAGLTEEEKQRIIIAYEPIFSIGTGIIPTIEEISTVIQKVKKDFPKNKILYGGSANEENLDELKKCLLIDGYLLGGLSLKIESLKKFLTKLEN